MSATRPWRATLISTSVGLFAILLAGLVIKSFSPRWSHAFFGWPFLLASLAVGLSGVHLLPLARVT